MITYLTGLAIFIFSTNVPGTTSHPERLSQEGKTFTTEELREDLQYLFNSIIEYNPAIGVFHPEEELKVTYDSLRLSISSPLTDLGFYPKVARLLASTHEGHTIPNDQADTITNIVKGFFNGDYKFLPVSIYHSDDEYYISGNFTGIESAAQGDKIVSINGRTISDIVNDISCFVQVDGNIALARKNVVCGNIGAYYYWFIDTPEKFEIEYIPTGSSRTEITTLPAISRDSMIHWRNEIYGIPEPDTPSINDVYTLKFDGNIAILDLSTFSKSQREKYNINTEYLYKDIFEEIAERNAAKLVIDLRDNPGGRKEYVYDILPYLIKKGMKGLLYTSESWKGKKTKYKLPKRAKSAFNGDIYVFINNASFSNASVLAGMVHKYGDAVLIGEETRSRYEGFAAGSNQKITLPNTQIPVFIPRYIMRYDEPQSQYPNRGVIPDHTVPYLLEDKLNKQDTHFDKCMNVVLSTQ